jgi:hypothetical protein
MLTCDGEPLAYGGRRDGDPLPGSQRPPRGARLTLAFAIASPRSPSLSSHWR